MEFLTLCSKLGDSKAVAKDLKTQLGGFVPRFAVFFASARFDAAELGAALRVSLGKFPCIGCASAGEIVSGGMLKGSVVMLAMGDEAIHDAVVVTIKDAKSADSVKEAFAALARGAGSPLHQLDGDEYVGLVLHDGLAGAEESVMAALSSVTNVPFVGGSASDELRFEVTRVFNAFEPRSGSAVLALLRPKRSFRVLKTQSFEPLDRTFVVTDADEATRTVIAFDGKPAALEYAKAVGVPVEALVDEFQRHPLGLMLPNGEPYVRSPREIVGTSVAFYCQVPRGARLSLLRARDIVADTRRDLAKAITDLGASPRALINFHCILRTLELEQKSQCDAYGAVFSEVPTVGFSTYGESYVGHINQTSTMVLFA